MVTIIRYAQRIQYLYASFNNILVVSWRPFFLLARGSINTQRKRLIFRMPMSNDNRIVSSVNRTRQLYTGMHFHVISVFFYLIVDTILKFGNFIFRVHQLQHEQFRRRVTITLLMPSLRCLFLNTDQKQVQPLYSILTISFHVRLELSR